MSAKFGHGVTNWEIGPRVRERSRKTAPERWTLLREEERAKVRHATTVENQDIWLENVEAKEVAKPKEEERIRVDMEEKVEGPVHTNVKEDPKEEAKQKIESVTIVEKKDI